MDSRGAAVGAVIVDTCSRLESSNPGGAGPGPGAGAAPIGAQPERLRYGGDLAFPPFESRDATGLAHGIQIDLLAALGPLIGVEFSLSLQPWALTEQAFRAGELDLVAMVDTAQRRRWALFTAGHATPILAVYGRQGEPERQSLPALAGLRLAVLDSAAMRETCRTWLVSLSGPFLPMADASQALLAVQQGQADVALLPRAFADRLLAEGCAPGVLASRLSLRVQTYALAVAPGRVDLQQRLQQGLDQLEADGRLEQLRLRWLGSHQAEATLLRAEQLLLRFFDQHTDPMLLVEHGSGIVRDANVALLQLLGLPAEQLVGQPLQALGDLIDAKTLQGLAQALSAHGCLDALPLRVHLPDGRPCDVLLSADLLRVGGTAHVFCLLRDITAQLAQDTLLRESFEALSVQLQLAHKALGRAQARQALAEDRLNEFTRAVSHDVKTPLNAVHGFAGLLRQRLTAGHVQEALGHAERIEQAARRMAAMIDGLGRLAQVGRLPLQRQPLNMAQLVHDCWALLQPQLAGQQVVLQVQALPDAQGDADLVAQVWQNLLGNAVKYSATADPARIDISSHQDARGIWYRVADNGVGFKMVDASRLFIPFQRLHEGGRFEGTGIGLSLVHRIVGHHGGEVRLHSAPGEGTVAEFTLGPAPG